MSISPSLRPGQPLAMGPTPQVGPRSVAAAPARAGGGSCIDGDERSAPWKRHAIRSDAPTQPREEGTFVYQSELTAADPDVASLSALLSAADPIGVVSIFVDARGEARAPRSTSRTGCRTSSAACPPTALPSEPSH